MMLLLKRACHIVATLLASPPPPSSVCAGYVVSDVFATPVPNQCTRKEEALLHGLSKLLLVLLPHPLPPHLHPSLFFLLMCCC